MTGADELDLDPDAAAVEAWDQARRATGLTEQALAGYVADYFRFRVADLDRAESRAKKLVPERLARQYTAYPLREDDRHLVVATSDPTDFAAEQALGFISGRKAVFEVAPPRPILERIEAGYGSRSRPRSEERAPAAASEPTLAQGAPGPGAGDEPDEAPIMMVDDDPEDRLLVRTLLQKHGFEVEEARDGEQALARIRQGPAPALLVLDLELPVLDGREVLARLRSEPSTAALPVIVLTGSPDPEDEYRLMEEGADDYLRKPLDPPRFIARVKAALRRARMTGT